MFTSISAILTYGHDLGRPASLHGVPSTSGEDFWWETHFCADALRALYDSIPGLPDYDTADEPAETVADILGVRIHYYASRDSGTHILSTAILTVDSFETLVVDPTTMLSDPGHGRWDEQLDHAMAVLGLAPRRPQPAWLLTAIGD